MRAELYLLVIESSGGCWKKVTNIRAAQEV